MQFILYIGITLAKVYNLMSYFESNKKVRDISKENEKGSFFDLKIGFILFMLLLIAWGVGFVVFLLDPEEFLYLMLFRFETWFLLLNVCVFLAEIILHLARQAKLDTRGKAFNSLEMNKV